MAKLLSREERIRQEINRLKDIYADIEESKYKIAQSLIENQAFMAVILQDIQEDIKTSGWSEGLKESPSVTTYNKMIKNLSVVTKQLENLLPKQKQEAVKKSKLDAFLEM